MPLLGNVDELLHAAHRAASQPEEEQNNKPPSPSPTARHPPATHTQRPVLHRIRLRQHGSSKARTGVRRFNGIPRSRGGMGAVQGLGYPGKLHYSQTARGL